MATLSIPNTFVNGTPADGTKVNENFAGVVTVVNAVDNENIAVGAGILESKIAFSTSGGHNHDGVDSTLADVTTLALAQVNHASGGRGTIKIKKSTSNVSVPAQEDATVTFTGEAFTDIPLIQIYCATLVSLGNMFYIHTVATTGFKIYNSMPSTTLAFSWIAIGV